MISYPVHANGSQADRPSIEVGVFILSRMDYEREYKTKPPGTSQRSRPKHIISYNKMVCGVRSERYPIPELRRAHPVGKKNGEADLE
ncbi:hypothetical protein ACOSQ2_003131 [Xanthoceras sorbifolium]